MINNITANCEPFFTSNDNWWGDVARDLVDRLHSLNAAPNRSAALVVGVGTLPFTLDLLPSTVVVADLHQSVIDGVTDRCKAFAQLGSWADYLDKYATDSPVTTEFGHMKNAGLVRDFDRIRVAARRLTIVPAVGNVILTAPELFARKPLRDKKITFVNFTNIAQYLRRVDGTRMRDTGRAVLATLLNELPVHEQAVICDSSSGQVARLYTRKRYLEFAA